MAAQASPRHVFAIHYRPDEIARPWPIADNLAKRIEWSWDHYQRALARMQWLDDDSLPCLDCMTGTDIFASAFGCAVHLPKDDMPFALPMVHCAAEAGKLKVPSLDAPPLRQAFQMADELVRRAGKGALVRPVDIQSPMDIAALIWDKNDFFMAMIETPDAVRELAYKCRTLLTSFMDEWFSRYGRDWVAHYPEYYMERGITLSEDEIGIVSNEMFEDLFLPELVALSEHFGGIGIHSCADSRLHWESFRKIPNLRFLNLKRELRQEAYPFFAPRIPQQHGDGAEDQWDLTLRNAPQARLYIDLWAADREEALRLTEKYARIAGR